MRSWRLRSLLTQEQLAERAGLSVRTIRRLESGELHRPLGHSLRLLATAMGLTVEERARLGAAAGREPGPARAPAPAPAGVPRQLPADVAGFAGRTRDLARLDALLGACDADPAVVISAIAGAAGVGKTALAVHWAHHVSDRFPEGQLYIDLRGYAPGPPTTPGQALAVLLHGLGVEPGRIPADEETAAALYRSLLAGRRLLVILDNARDPAQVRPLLPGAPGCMAVVTSRDRLAGLVASHGARQVVLHVLPPDEAGDLLRSILGSDRVTAEPEATARLAELCGHLPLALRIAAANIEARAGRSIADYASELAAGDRLAELEVAGDPQAAVRVAFDWSYAALEPETRLVFRRLGLVPGPDFDTTAAAALAGEPAERVAGRLSRLSAAHFLEGRGPGRHCLHDLLRRYARERALAEDGDQGCAEALARLFDGYLAGVDAAARLLDPAMVRLPVHPPAADVPVSGFSGGAAALVWLDAEHLNLIAAIRHAAEHGPLPAAWRLADALRGYLLRRRQPVDWVEIVQVAVGAADASGGLRAQAALRICLGLACWNSGQPEAAAGHHTAARDLARQAGWLEGEASSLNNLGNVCWAVGDLRRSAEHQASALAIHRQVGRRLGEALTLINLGASEGLLGRLADACHHLAEALAIDRELGHANGEAFALVNLAAMEHEMGMLAQAEGDYETALALFQDQGDRPLEIHTLAGLASVHVDMGRRDQGREEAEVALRQAGETGHAHVEMEVLNALGAAHLALGDHRQASAFRERALAMATASGIRAQEARALIGLAEAQLCELPERCLESAERALAIALQYDHRTFEAAAHVALAAGHLACGRHDRAVEQAEHGLGMHRGTGSRLGEGRALVVLGSALHACGRPEAAADRWREALALFAEIGAGDAGEVRTRLAAT